MKAQLAIRAGTAGVVWLAGGLASGVIAAHTLGGHGSAVYIAFAAMLSIPGSLIHAASFLAQRPQQWRPMKRTLIVWLLACTPFTSWSLYWAVRNGDSSFTDLTSFIAMFCLPAGVVAAVAEWCVGVALRLRREHAP